MALSLDVGPDVSVGRPTISIGLASSIESANMAEERAPTVVGRLRSASQSVAGACRRVVHEGLSSGIEEIKPGIRFMLILSS
jgi:hypothetical protein